MEPSGAKQLRSSCRVTVSGRDVFGWRQEEEKEILCVGGGMCCVNGLWREGKMLTGAASDSSVLLG
jgi:hypothetical protein